MRLFLDTEFTDLNNRDLISIGLVSECGQHEFYAERNDFIMAWCNDFVRAEVLPHLGNVETVSREELKSQLYEFISNIGEEVVIACDFVGDFDLLKNALDAELPPNLSSSWFNFSDYKDSYVFYFAASEFHNLGNPRHHALHDAHAHRRGVLAQIEHLLTGTKTTYQQFIELDKAKREMSREIENISCDYSYDQLKKMFNDMPNED